MGEEDTQGQEAPRARETQAVEEKKRKLKRGDGTILVPFTSKFEYLDKTGQPTIARGRTFIIEGQELDLFPIGALCGMLGRSHKCIYKWEKGYGFPQAMWRIQDVKGCNRWYSRKQLMAILAVYKHMGRLKGENRSKLRAFVAAVRKVFFTIDRPIKDRSNE